MGFFGKKNKKEAAAPAAAEPEPELVIGEPTQVEHLHHVTADPTDPCGLKGLPPHWRELLKQSGLTGSQVSEQPDAVIGILTTMTEGPAPPPSPVLKRKYDLNELLTDGDPMVIYTDLKKFDSGANGEVFRAVRASDQAQVALKKIPIKSEKKELASLENEISMMYTSRHPNLVSFYDCYKKNNELWIAMEFMTGGKLTDLIDHRGSKGFSEAQIATLCKHSLEGLDYLHQMGRVHRDIKSDNILINGQGEIKLADLGFCADLEAGKRNTTVGTPYWMAPEVIRGQAYDGKADIWSTGIMALELADGQPPLMDQPPMRALYIIVTQPPPTVKHPTKWSDQCKDFIGKMLTVDPHTRPTANALLGHPFIEKAGSTDFIGQMLSEMKR